MKQRARTVAFHLLGWIMFAALVLAFEKGFDRGFDRFHLWPFGLFLLVYAGLFYLNAAFLLPRFYFRKKYLAYCVAAAMLFAATFFLKPFENLVIHGERPQREEGFGMPERFDREPPWRDGPRGRRQGIDIVSVVLFIGVWSASSVLQLFRKWRTTERRALQAEADKTSAELSFLKAQINPHFLFNTLNNIYSLAVTKNENTPDAVLKLSSILRYLTDDVRSDFVPLKSEVDCASDYIELQKLRLSKKVSVDFRVKGSVEDREIAPLLFMTFIENAFKYGISNHEDCTITIVISADHDEVRLFCRNRIFHRDVRREREGIGTGNARKRLAYLYPGKFFLHVDTENDFFTVELTIKNREHAN